MKLIRKSAGESYEPEKDWKRISLCNQPDISIEHFVKPAGHQSPRHRHLSAQVLVVLKGKIVVIGESEEYELSEGDTIYIRGNEEHVVKNPLDTVSIGLDIFVPGRSFDFWLNKSKENK